MRLLYSNILPLQIEEGKETIVEAINSQMRLADRIDIAVGYVSRASLDELDRFCLLYTSPSPRDTR